jgi:hypothetical protein
MAATSADVTEVLNNDAVGMKDVDLPLTQQEPVSDGQSASLWRNVKGAIHVGVRNAGIIIIIIITMPSIQIADFQCYSVQVCWERLVGSKPA